MAATCPWCQAPRDAGPSCPKCGANYAKAEQIKAKGRAQVEKPAAAPAPFAAAIVGIDDRPVEDPALELKFCIAAIPAAMLLALAFHFLTPGLQRIVFGMPVHELGHAVSAWFTGFWAIPTLWKTLIPDERGFLAPILLAGAIAWMMFRAGRAGKTYLVAIGVVLLVLQGLGTLWIRESTAIAIYTFGGDGAGMVLAAALMASFFFGKRSQLYQGSLRWGFLAIGAAAFTDMFATWWKALYDRGAIPIGEIEGVGLSDAARLLGEHFWTPDALVRRYVTVGVLCLVALAAVYAWGVWRARKAARGAT
ncbi:MAG TPA: hypothetical protein VF943_14030 [Burkholderiales bacterium]